MAQLKPLDSNLQRSIQMHNLMLDNPGTVQMHQVLVDNGLAVVIYDGKGTRAKGRREFLGSKRKNAQPAPAYASH
ncbi:hypothetical protein L596_010019 [Steinernema carpocapsae]|uniref:Uncharacterized protein n=1 Tax=Steinernema carpocapsae TaxID=34508 RepID=A0A4U5PH23_STECR|nr:hypothetical protein L596_010019 [Steinernema carpocapsae]